MWCRLIQILKPCLSWLLRRGLRPGASHGLRAATMECSGFLVPIRLLGIARFGTRLGSTMKILAASRLPTREILVKFQTSRQGGAWGRVRLLTPFYSAYLRTPQEFADRRSLGHFSSHSLISGRSHSGKCDGFSHSSNLTSGSSLLSTLLTTTIRLTVFSSSSHLDFFCDNFRSIRETIINTTSDIGLIY